MVKKISKTRKCSHTVCTRLHDGESKYCNECIQVKSKECNWCKGGKVFESEPDKFDDYKDFVKAERREKIIKIIASILIITGIFGVYELGVMHGSMKISFAIGSLYCDKLMNMTPIYPYGCEHNNLTDTQCIIMDCQALGYNNNGAVCGNFNNSKTFFGTNGRLQTMMVGLSLTGCPMYIEDIGINLKTGNRNWWLK